MYDNTLMTQLQNDKDLIRLLGYALQSTSNTEITRNTFDTYSIDEVTYPYSFIYYLMPCS
jgi:hypothetical protein